MDPFFKSENAPDFSLPSVRQEFVQNTHDAKSLLQKELDVNQMEQQLLKQRIQMMNEFINSLPSIDPHYSMLCIQVKMDQVELDELKFREASLIRQLEETL
ncbi:MAG: hypothetical protein JSS32_04020 [Verrucomicrobia bacterium]|nr:hypothetical protein [Verrucomicrobiota bacterium]